MSIEKKGSLLLKTSGLNFAFTHINPLSLRETESLINNARMSEKNFRYAVFLFY